MLEASQPSGSHDDEEDSDGEDSERATTAIKCKKIIFHK